MTTQSANVLQCLAPPVPTLPFLSQGAITTITSPLATASTLPPATLVPQKYGSLPVLLANPGVNTQPTFVGLGTPLSYVPPSVDAKSLPLSGVVTAPDVSLPQPSAGQTSGRGQPVTASVTPTIIVRQPKVVRPYTGATSYNAYREYFERLFQCNSRMCPPYVSGYGWCSF